MKLYYSPGACSLAPHIVASEAGVPLELEKVDLSTHTLADGSNYYDVNPRGYVPAVRIKDGEPVLTEANVVVQFIADQKPESGLMPKAGTPERYRAQQWLAFIATELHKNFSWLWQKDTSDETKAAVKAKLEKRFAELDAHLKSNDYLLGKNFSAADAYAFTIINWVNFLGMNLKSFPSLQAYMDRVAARPKVQETLKSEGLLAA
ncbi:glutathione transferase GstA [Nordella sp. HKS 07]|uniref:glutathione transferase GstA n=1 Tax=Nordella sp. HKS 07 TaxID=2712222 RepID=UPI0013E20567|nr:glutathione transferase GstA [Nordella sp. HKS 07]QIG50354.1 glutathione transferase GstA [Nordella sp. HKS 07]